MSRIRLFKSILICALSAGLVWLASSSSSQTVKPGQVQKASYSAADYVGSDACKDCHEDQFKAFSHTSHAQLAKISSWKSQVTGCESCHGPGKKHTEEGDPTKIISFKNKSSKEISETCLTCHAGKEERNNFRRGEHWRNDIGCTDCHTTHSESTKRNVPGSITLVGAANAEKRDFSTLAMLKVGEPQLCISCHGEVKPDFNKPFHHKVLEGVMKCSDCHNPHGGFELKQTRLATGADAACIKCHADKQGPFTYEHAPLKTEGCAACHTPHGSSHPRLLRFNSTAQLCLTCHSVAHDVGAIEPAGPQHNQNAQYANCTACHVKVHGSRTSPVFFR
ncbi:MAG TPA: DmsE family decaheme c-type cytochrome [Pyrinomonadaceae bacterium]|nr:DmsE family decaheme c-type cytochrome [Pyrinomonadaceae bacterium]